MVSRFRPVFLSLIALGFAALSACDKVALLAPTGSTLTLSINTTTVPINGTATVTASVIESAGTPVHNGTAVTFTSSFGTIEPAEAVTSGGVATAVFRGTSSGTAKISAFSGSAKAEITDVKVGGAAAATVAMRSTPSSLPQGGGSVEIFAIIRDASGNLLPGAPVSFTSDQGNLSSTSAISDAGGEAKVSLTTNRDAVVTATVIAGVAATTNVRIINAPTVTITSTTPTPGVGVGVNFTVTPGAAGQNGAPIQSASVNWGDGSAVLNLGPISGATNLTHIFNQAGNYTVTASVVDATGQGSSSTISVNVQRIAPVVTLTPASSTIAVGGALAFSVTAVPGTGGPPVQNVQVVVNPGGTVVYNSSGGGSFTRTFTSTGSHTLTATATDTSGTTGSASAVVSVTGFDVTLDATGLSCGATSPKVCTGLTAGANVTFTANVTTAGVSASSYTWSWGDGQPAETTTARVNSHVFASAGTFVVQVTVTSTAGATSNQIITIKP